MSESCVLGARSHGYLVRRTVVPSEAPASAATGGSTQLADTPSRSPLPLQEWPHPDA